MSNLWHKQSGGDWQAQPLDDGAVQDGAAIGAAGIAFVRFGRGADRGVALLGRADCPVRVNGEPVVGGLRVLEHRDELLVGHARLYYSAEGRPEVAPFQAQPAARLPTCPVCRGPIRDGQPAVRCPGCPRWYHQIEATEGKPAKRCWTYADRCSFCRHPTSLSGEAVWRPETEESHG